MPLSPILHYTGGGIVTQRETWDLTSIPLYNSGRNVPNPFRLVLRPVCIPHPSKTFHSLDLSVTQAVVRSSLQDSSRTAVLTLSSPIRIPEGALKILASWLYLIN